MTEQNVAAEDFNLSLLDPNSWEEPKELIPVRVKTSGFRWSAPEYNKATQFRAAFPHTGNGPEGNSIQQWHLELERLDAVYALPDGTTAPVILYGGGDLQKLDKNGTLRGIMKTRGKEQFVIGAWTKLVGSLVPDPSRIQGMFLNVERFREKEIAPGFFAKNVIVPVEVLAPTFTYTGPVQRFDARRDAAESALSGGSPSSGSVGISKAEAATMIRTFLEGKGIDAAKADIDCVNDPAFPADAKVEPFLTAMATGQLASTLASYN